MKSKKVIVIPDMHVPFHDKTVWRVIQNSIKLLGKGDEVVIIGDFADCYSISSHPKGPGKPSFLQEITAVNRELDKLSKLTDERGVKVMYVEGNHEERLPRYLTKNAPDLFGCVDNESLFRIWERGWCWTPYRHSYTIGKMDFTHDYRYCGKNAARQTLEAYGNNICFGHTHRGTVVYTGSKCGGTHVALNVGWGGDLKAIEYMHTRKPINEWQHGFGYVFFEPNGNCHAHFIPIVDGRAVVEGEIIK